MLYNLTKEIVMREFRIKILTMLLFSSQMHEEIIGNKNRTIELLLILLSS